MFRGRRCTICGGCKLASGECPHQLGDPFDGSTRDMGRAGLHVMDHVAWSFMKEIYGSLAIAFDSSWPVWAGWKLLALSGSRKLKSKYLLHVYGKPSLVKANKSTLFDELLTGEDDSLCSGVFDLVDDYFPGEIYPRDVGVVIHVWSTNYHICNAGFESLFRCEFDDPNAAFKAMIEAYDAIQCPNAAAAFREAISLFPGGFLPEDVNERGAIYKANDPDRRDAINGRYYEANNDGAIIRALAHYIRHNADIFRQLEDTPTDE